MILRVQIKILQYIYITFTLHYITLQRTNEGMNEERTADQTN